MLKKLIDTAMGRIKADLVLKNAEIINVFSGKIVKGDIAVCGGKIAGIGSYDNYENAVDCAGKYALPGFIDSHVHIESSHLTPCNFARAVVPCGTTTVIADPHEIANVCGIDGIKFIYAQSKKLPLDIKIMFPSCVPATGFETSGATLGGSETEKYLQKDMFFGLGEFMNVPGIIFADKEALKKAEAAKFCQKPIDGHAPGISGKELDAYACSGVNTDHECVCVLEMLEKIEKGMYVLIREGSAAKNLAVLAKGVTSSNLRRCLLCTDDRAAEDILSSGHIDNAVRTAVKCGISPVSAVTMATLNAAECYGLKGKGAIAPGYDADIVITDSLESLKILQVYCKGKLCAENGRPLFNMDLKIPENLKNTVKLKDITEAKLQIHLKSDTAKVIRLNPKSIVTENVSRKVPVEGGCFRAGKGYTKVAVFERHKFTGNIGLAIVENYGIKDGVLALTVAHDSHNIIAAGDNDGDMIEAARELERTGGGITIIKNGKAVMTLPLEIGGLISTADALNFASAYAKLRETAYAMGVNREIEPFMSLSFISLPVIPHLKVTDMGLFDVDKFGFTGFDA